MEKYIYLLLGLSTMILVAIFWVLRPDLRPKMLKFGVAGGLIGLIAELFYFRDYWRPPSLLGEPAISIEDFLFGFAMAALGYAAYAVFFKARFGDRVFPGRKKLYGLLFVTVIAAMLIVNVWWGVNSIFVSSISILVVSAIMVGLRPDLAKVAAGSLLLLVPMVLIYLVLFDWLAPNFWDNYWLLADAGWGITILGNLPVTEFIWYASWFIFSSISYPFASGRQLTAKH